MQDNIETSLKEHLTTTFIGRHIHCYASATSTMEIAKILAVEGAPEGTVVIADEQTSGRGRLNRKWLSPKHNLYMSVIFRPVLEHLPKLIMVSSVAVIKAIKTVSGIEARIKWPNDILIDSKKVCGILIENQIHRNKVDFSVIGIGLNIDFNPLTVPEIATTATSLNQESGAKIARHEIAHAILSELEKQYLNLEAGNLVYHEWCNTMQTIGKSIKINTGQEILNGIAEAVIENGNLIFRGDDGKLCEITSGDVTIVNK